MLECSSADTGVGPSIADDSQGWRPNWADLPVTARSRPQSGLKLFCHQVRFVVGLRCWNWLWINYLTLSRCFSQIVCLSIKSDWGQLLCDIRAPDEGGPEKRPGGTALFYSEAPLSQQVSSADPVAQGTSMVGFLVRELEKLQKQTMRNQAPLRE